MIKYIYFSIFVSNKKLLTMISIKNSLVATLMVALLISFSACTKTYEERLEGVWEWVNISDIDDDVVEEWHFINNEFSIERYNVNNIDSVWIYERGSFFIEANLFGKSLHISETSINSYNTKWDVIKLKDDILIISNDVDGGILYKEFIKLNK